MIETGKHGESGEAVSGLGREWRIGGFCPGPWGKGRGDGRIN